MHTHYLRLEVATASKRRSITLYTETQWRCAGWATVNYTSVWRTLQHGQGDVASSRRLVYAGAIPAHPPLSLRMYGVIDHSLCSLWRPPDACHTLASQRATVYEL